MIKRSVFVVLVLGILGVSPAKADVETKILPKNEQHFLTETGKLIAVQEVRYISGNSRLDLIGYEDSYEVIIKIQTQSGRYAERLFRDLTVGPESTLKLSSDVQKDAKNLVVHTEDRTFYFLDESFLYRSFADNDPGLWAPFINPLDSTKKANELSRCVQNASSFRKHIAQAGRLRHIENAGNTMNGNVGDVDPSDLTKQSGHIQDGTQPFEN